MSAEIISLAVTGARSAVGVGGSPQVAGQSARILSFPLPRKESLPPYVRLIHEWLAQPNVELRGWRSHVRAVLDGVE